MSAATFSTNGTVKQTLYNVRDYGTNVAPDAVKRTDALMAAGTNVLSSASGSFVSPGDVGKAITVIGAGPIAIINGVNVATDLRTTIASVVSGQQVTLGGIAQNSVTNGTYFYGTDAHAALQAAVNAAGVNGGAVYLSPGAWYLSGRVTICSGIRIYGDNSTSTIIYGGSAVDYVFYYSSATVPITGFRLDGLTLDNCWLSRGSVLRLENANNCWVDHVSFLNTHAWGVVLGQRNPATNTALSMSNTFIDCAWSGHTGSLEMLLVFNAKDTRIIRCSFTGNVGGGPMLGLWQKCYATRIEAPRFIGTDNGSASEGIYYSFTCDNTVIDGLYAENIGPAISGANVSDYGQFGVNYVDNLQILNPTIIGGPNSVNSAAITLGGVTNCTVDNPCISFYQIGINMIPREPLLASSMYVDIKNPKIRNCGQGAGYPQLHPAISISAHYTQYLKILGGALYDDQATPTQLYPIAIWNGAANYLTIKDVVLSAPPGGQSIVFHDGGSLGQHDVFLDNQAFSGTHPGQVTTAPPPIKHAVCPSCVK